MLIDTHAHLFWESYEKDLDQVIKRSLDADVNTVINVGVDLKLSKLACQLENPNLKIYSSIAIHPEEAPKYTDPLKITQDIQELKNLFNQYPQKIVAIGECGLDYSYLTRPDYLPPSLSPEQAKDLQRQLFKAQIDLAKNLNLPLLIHVRDDRSQDKENIECWEETLEMVKDWKGILHCYSGTMAITKKIPKNFLVSFAGNLTYPKNDYLHEAVIFLPLEKICLETDCPFLAPQSIRGQRNEPASVLEVANFIAELKQLPLEQIANQTTENVKKLLSI